MDAFSENAQVDVIYLNFPKASDQINQTARQNVSIQPDFSDQL